MSRNLSHKGKGLDNEPQALPFEADHSEGAQSAQPSSRPTLPTPFKRRTNRAINDAQSSLDALLISPAETGAPQIISASGRIRNETRGRIAGPTPDADAKNRLGKAPRPPYILNGGLEDDDDQDTELARGLAIVPGTAPLYALDDTHDVPNTVVGRGIALANGKLQTARERASLLVSAVDGPGALGLAPDEEALHTSRRAASQWATRYATHIVIVLVVGVLVTLGGLKTFTTQGAYNKDLQSAAALGTDHIDDDDASYNVPGQTSMDSPDYKITLPRTELGGGSGGAARQVIPPGSQPVAVQPGDVAGQPKSAPNPSAGIVVKYTVAAGDTVESIAQKFNLMPETIMGCNGIYDNEEILAAGRQLIVPPIDGMYYVVEQGDNLQDVADFFQVVPEVITQYAPNNVHDGVLKVGEAVLVPGGMIPPREETVTYTVRQGDTMRRIAARFGIDVPTIAYANNIDNPDSLAIGTQLRLLPLPGIEYTVQKGDTLAAIADKTGVTPQTILDYPLNNLTADSPLQADTVIMVPGGSPPTEAAAAHVEPVSRGASRPAERPASKPDPIKPAASDNSSASDSSDSSSSAKPATSNNSQAKSSSSSSSSGNPKTVASKPAQQSSSNNTPPPTPRPTARPKPVVQQASSVNSPRSGTGNLIWPVNGRISQYFSSRHNGLDLAISAGTPIHAADSGKVVWAGWRTDGLGYCVMIDHLDGLTTVYGHMIRQPAVYVGQYVRQGQVIGYIGSTGHSTGPHVHFMVKSGSAISHSYRNPLGYLGGR